MQINCKTFSKNKDDIFRPQVVQNTPSVKKRGKNEHCCEKTGVDMAAIKASLQGESLSLPRVFCRQCVCNHTVTHLSPQPPTWLGKKAAVYVDMTDSHGQQLQYLRNKRLF